MRLLKRITALLALVLLAACSNIETVKDFENRSVAYGWVDIKDVEINRVSAIYIQQYRPKTDSPYYTTGFRKLKDGYVFWTIALPVGSHKLDTIKGQTCLAILCGNTLYSYNFGKQGDDVGAVVIQQPGVYHLGSFRMKNEKTGFFEAGKFQVTPADNAPSKREMLELILKEKETQEEPVMVERIKRELARLG
ncbi:MAG TPA: hypothetical protein VF522_06330 [Ramlibacter sp.]|uniref:hypothetical protein n=1 Tax=Ramlibacter sp. TaxID=1917967 RepID=UPI002ED4F941